MPHQQLAVAISSHGASTGEYWILSPDEPSGTSWLLNALLALDLEVFHGPRDHFWERNAHGKWELHSDAMRFERWLPIFSTHKEFAFESDLRGRWLHDYPPAHEISHPVIFFVRDGRGANYSHYRRHKEETIPFAEYLAKPYRDEFYGGACTPDLGAMDCWALYILLWSRRLPPNSLVMRFEDSKKDPISELKRALSYLGESRGTEALAEAVRVSSVEEAKKAQDAYDKKAQSAQPYAVHRKGSIDEWKTIFGPRESQYLEGLPNLALKKLGYQCDSPVPAIACSTLKSGSSAKLRHVLMQIEVGNVGGAKGDLEELARNLEQDFDVCFAVGKALRCYFWTQHLHPESNLSNRFVQQTLQDLIYFTRFLAPKPLSVISVAKEFVRLGRADLASFLTLSILVGRAFSFHENLEAAEVLWNAGQREKASELLEKAMHQADIPEPEKVVAARKVFRRYSMTTAFQMLSWAKYQGKWKVMMQEVTWRLLLKN